MKSRMAAWKMIVRPCSPHLKQHATLEAPETPVVSWLLLALCAGLPSPLVKALGKVSVPTLV